MALQTCDDKLLLHTHTLMPIRIKHYATGTNAIYNTSPLVLNFHKSNMHLLGFTWRAMCPIYNNGQKLKMMYQPRAAFSLFAYNCPIYLCCIILKTSSVTSEQ
jgi:hypothetical protein